MTTFCFGCGFGELGVILLGRALLERSRDWVYDEKPCCQYQGM